MVGRIEEVFPGLRGSGYKVTSPPEDTYNCIAWAAGDATRWWWPDEPGHPDSSHWPPDVPRSETLDAFRQAFATLGYSVCDDDRLEVGYEKVALFALEGVPAHAARQLSNGRWTSKLGPREDIEHALHDLSGLVYGSAVLIMKNEEAAASRSTGSCRHLWIVDVKRRVVPVRTLIYVSDKPLHALVNVLANQDIDLIGLGIAHFDRLLRVPLAPLLVGQFDHRRPPWLQDGVPL
jgi:hypothetical protein